MATTHTLRVTRPFHFNGMDGEADYDITFTYRPGRPDYYNRSGGHWEQGWPASIEFVSVAPEFGPLDVGAFTDLAQADLDDWAEDWLAENADKATDKALDDIESPGLEALKAKLEAETSVRVRLLLASQYGVRSPQPALRQSGRQT